MLLLSLAGRRCGAIGRRRLGFARRDRGGIGRVLIAIARRLRGGVDRIGRIAALLVLAGRGRRRACKVFVLARGGRGWLLIGFAWR
jgi:hypothetical protein